MGGTSSVSLLMCIIAISMVIWFKLYKSFTYRLAVYQVSSSLALSVALCLSTTLVKYDETELYYQVMCRVDAFLLQYTALVKLLFTMCLNFHIFCLAVFFRNLKKFEVGYIVLSCGLPLLVACIPFISDLYGMAGAWCWIKTWKHNCATNHYFQGILEQFLLWYGPLVLSLSFSVIGVLIVMLVLVCRLYNCQQSSLEKEHLLERESLEAEERKSIKKALRDLLPLLVYPIIFYLLTLLPLVNRIYSSISPHPSYWWAFAHSFSQSLWGFFSGTTLLLHIFLARRFIVKKHNVSVTQNGSGVKYSESNVFTTNCGTSAYNPPTESIIDVLLD